MPIIDVRDLVKRYPASGRHVTALDGVSLQVAAGETFALAGPSGAGKTTTVRIMSALLAPTSGTVVIAGHDAGAEPAAVHRAIGVTPQDAGRDVPRQTVGEFLTNKAELHAMPQPAARAGELLDLAGLRRVAGCRVWTLTAGMRRRLDLAVGLVHRPVVLLLDEPTEGLDPAAKGELWERVRRLPALGITIVFSTRSLQEAHLLADRMAVMDGGRIAVEGVGGELPARAREHVIECRTHSAKERTVS